MRHTVQAQTNGYILEYGKMREWAGPLKDHAYSTAKIHRVNRRGGDVFFTYGNAPL